MTLLQRSLLLVAICLAPGVLAQAVNTVDLRDARLQEIQNGALQQSISYSTDLNQLFEGFHQLLVTVSLMPAVRGQEPEGCRALLATVAQNNGNLANIGLADVNGRTVCAAAPAPSMIDLSRAPFRVAMDGGDFEVGDYGIMEGGSPAAVPMAMPVRDQRGATTAVLWAIVTPDALTKYLRNRALAPNSALVVSDRNGAIIASAPDESLVGQHLPPSLMPLVAGKVIGTADAVGPDRTRRYFVYVPLGLRPLGQFVAVGVDEAASLQQIARATWRAIAFIAVGTVVGFGFAVVGSRHFLQRPIGRLVQAAQRWREGDLSARAELPGGVSEISTLGTAFDEMAAALDSRTRELVEAKRRAEQRASDAESAEQQKSLLLQEVNHRVKNSLQLVSSLLNLQGGTMSDEEGHHRFAAAAARVQTIARVHARLFQTGNVRSVEFGQYLRDLCADLARTYARQEQEPRFDIDVARVELPTDRVIPLALIVNELLTNVFKYAYGPGEPVRVDIATRLDGADTLRVTIADEGSGLPPGFDLHRSGGLGMRLIESLVAQLGARLEVQRPARGTRFVLRVPLNGAAAGAARAGNHPAA